MYIELRRLPFGRSRRTTVKPHWSFVLSSLRTGASGFRRETMSWMFRLPQNCKTPVPPALNFPWTKGMRILFDLLRERNVSGNVAGD